MSYELSGPDQKSDFRHQISYIRHKYYAYKLF